MKIRLFGARRHLRDVRRTEKDAPVLRDHICSVCGKIYMGPHTGHRINGDPGAHMTYKDTPLSHGMCEKHMREWIAVSKRERGH